MWGVHGAADAHAAAGPRPHSVDRRARLPALEGGFWLGSLLCSGRQLGSLRFGCAGPSAPDRHPRAARGGAPRQRRRCRWADDTAGVAGVAGPLAARRVRLGRGVGAGSDGGLVPAASELSNGHLALAAASRCSGSSASWAARCSRPGTSRCGSAVRWRATTRRAPRPRPAPPPSRPPSGSGPSAGR